ncbi:MAG TPA: ROK family protein [Anaeromyxobacteraceae bacterium]|nr:ROK family protein [Anaeromyxobacteraceae bacterium]
MTAPGAGRIRIGVDLGGTKVEAVALDGARRTLARRRVPTPRHDYPGTLDAIAALVRDLEAEVGREGTVGVGIPGSISPATGLVKNANSTWLNGRPLDRDLAAKLGRPVRLANDANCFALSEATDGAAAGARVVFGVILGTGCGGGVVVGRKPLEGRNAIAGEWGHNPLPWPEDAERPGPPCWCGKRGCVETFVSGTGLARDFQEATGLVLAPPEIVALAEGGDAAAGAALDRYQGRLARALAALVNVLDPDVVVLGGGMSNVRRLYQGVAGAWGRWVFSDRVDTRLVPPLHGDSSGVRGAAWLWELAGVPEGGTTPG